MIAKRKVSVLGSTGSIGTNTLNVIRQHPESFDVVSLSAGSSLEVLKKQILEFSPRYVSVSTEALAADLKAQLPTDVKVDIFWGPAGHRQCVELSHPHIVMSAMMGSFGLEATLAAVIQNVAVLGVANKEILVMAGSFIREALEQSKTTLVPVDSEHSAIFQALMGNQMSAVKSLILTGSGGPFRTRPRDTFANITREEALKHPNWVMGSKITIDSATMMNKGLEFIEALRLFHIHRDQLKVVIHPESIVHSLVEYVDGSLMAQLGASDMRMPISLALNYPERLPLHYEKPFDLVKIGKLHFEEPDLEKFKCLKLAMNFDRYGSQGAVVLNAANEMAVDLFLKDKIRFIEIPDLVEEALETFEDRHVYSLSEVIDLDLEVKEWTLQRPLKAPRTSSRREAQAREMMPV